MYRAIIFDLDGVVCHTDRYHYQAWKALADREGWKFDEVMNEQLRGVSRRASLDVIMHTNNVTADEATIERYMETKNTIYRSFLETMTPKDVEADVLPTLQELKQKGMKIALGSSSRNAPLILAHTGLSPLFDVVVDGSMITHSKPDPEVFLKAAELLGYKANECMVVEDAVSGIEAALTGGFLPIAFRLDYPHVIGVRSFPELLDLLVLKDDRR